MTPAVAKDDGNEQDLVPPAMEKSKSHAPRLGAQERRKSSSQSEKSQIDPDMSIEEISKKFKLVATYDTLEGH